MSDEPQMDPRDDDGSVCVLCGRPWPGYQNACPCGGFCTWGPALGAGPDSWTIRADGGWEANPPPVDVVAS